MNNTKIRFVILTLLLLVFAVVKSFAQDARIQIGHLDRLESRASRVVSVDVPENMLLFASSSKRKQTRRSGSKGTRCRAERRIRKKL